MTQYRGDWRGGGDWKHGASLRKRSASATDSSMEAACAVGPGGTTVLGS